MRKKKILLLSDDLRTFSGIATQSKEIVLNTVDQFDWIQLGGLAKHPDEGKVFDVSDDVKAETGVQDASVKIYCVTGYGNPDILRQIIYTERPDAILHFTDPRFWGWLYEMEYEIRKEIPIVYYTIWDCDPIPVWNKPFYLSCDLLMAISMQTHNLVKQTLKGEDYQDWQITYVPHGINPKYFFPVDSTSECYAEYVDFKMKMVGNAKFVVFYNSRNVRRKHTTDLILAYREFCKKLPADQAKDCLLLLHTQPIDDNGTDLIQVVKHLCPEYAVKFTGIIASTKDLNYLYNLADVTVNIASNEGFGLGTAESVMAGTPIVVNVTGGLQDQCGFRLDSNELVQVTDFNENHFTNAVKKYTQHGEWVKPVWPKVRTMQGSPQTPFIWDDIADYQEAAESMMYWYQLSPEERKHSGKVGREHFLKPEVGLNSIELGLRFKQNFNTLFENWKPRTRINLIKA